MRKALGHLPLPRPQHWDQRGSLHGLLCPNSLTLMAFLFLCGSSCTELAHPVLHTLVILTTPFQGSQRKLPSGLPSMSISPSPPWAPSAAGRWQGRRRLVPFSQQPVSHSRVLPGEQRICLYPSCSAEIKPISHPSWWPGCLDILPLMTAPPGCPPRLLRHWG